MPNGQQPKKVKPPVTLSPDEQAAFEQGLRSEATSKDYNIEEVFEFARKRRKEWTKQPAKATA